jgi:hypothetical protein
MACWPFAARLKVIPCCKAFFAQVLSAAFDRFFAHFTSLIV